MRSRFSLAVAWAVLAVPLVLRADTTPRNRPGLPLRAEPVEVRLTDGSRVFLTPGEEQIDIVTPYGKLQIKLADIQKIEFGARVPPEMAKRIAAAVALLDSGEEKRADAWMVLAGAKENAYPALQRLIRHADRTVAARAAEMAAKLRGSVPVERLRRIDRDVIHTEISKFVGRIELAEFRVTTPHFGPLKLRLGDLASLTRGEVGDEEEVPANVQPDPGYLSNFQQHLGQSFYFRVTGGNGGTVWGSDVYTTDSPLATAAVHAGVLKLGQTGIVKVTILPGQNAYSGSMRNGISTSGYGQYPGSYKVSRVGRPKEE